jgi:hypothetical protein
VPIIHGIKTGAEEKTSTRLRNNVYSRNIFHNFTGLVQMNDSSAALVSNAMMNAEGCFPAMRIKASLQSLCGSAR